MEGFLVKKDILIDTPKHTRFYRQSPTNQPNTAYIIINNVGEAKYILDKLKELDIDTTSKDLVLYQEKALLSWPNAPLKIGRVSYNMAFSNEFYTHSEPFCLAAQLAVLKAKKPNKKHYRLLIINGFGGNLGDSLIGISAFSHVAKVLEKELGSFSVDIMLGIDANPYNTFILKSKPYIENIYFAGLSLLELGNYDAYFDTTNLINLPNYSTDNRFDWYLWWFGLDPYMIDQSQKRNFLGIHYQANLAVESLLKGINNKKILFVHKASVPLRTFPKHIAAAFARNLLQAAKDITLIVDTTLNIKHSRLLDLEGKIDNPEKFKALCGLVDGVITIDSFGLHVADAYDKPAVALLSSTSASQYSYYPFTEFIEIDNARDLPAFGKVKVSDEEYKELEPLYEQSWRTLNAELVWEYLSKKLESKEAKAPRVTLCTDLKPPIFCKVSDTITFNREKTNTLYAKTGELFLNTVRSFLRQGNIFLGSTLDTSIYIQASRIVAFSGKVIAYEPRRLKFQALCGSFAINGSNNAYAFESLCADKSAKHSVFDFDAYSESEPFSIGNVPKLVDIKLDTIDNLDLEYCNMIALCAPSDYAAAVKGAMKTIEQFEPFIAMGPILKPNIPLVCNTINTIYDCWAMEIESNTQAFFILATTKKKNMTINGFLKIQQ